MSGFRTALLALAACSHAPPPAPRGPAASVRAEISLAETAERARQHDVARGHYLRAIELAPDPPNAAYARHEYAETLAAWGETVDARAELERAAVSNPRDAAVWHDLGILRNHDGDHAGAIAALQRAEQLAPNDLRPRIALAALYWSQGDKASATREYRGLLALDLPERLRTKVRWALDELAKP
jgi:Flp pilus assembly protein TadD